MKNSSFISHKDKNNKILKYSIRKVSTVGAASAIIGAVGLLAPTFVLADEEISNERTETIEVVTSIEAVDASVEDAGIGIKTVDNTSDVLEVTTSVNLETSSELTSELSISESAVITSNSTALTNFSGSTAFSGSENLVSSELISSEWSASEAANTESVSQLSIQEKLEQLNEEIRKIVTTNLSDDEISQLSADDIEALNKIDFTDGEVIGTGVAVTYKDLKSIVETFLLQDARYAVPYFKADTIINMPAFDTVDAQTMEKEELDVWDSWPVQDAVTGIVSNWNGYQLVVSMAGAANKNSNHIYLLYNEYGNNDFSNWRNAGPIFGYNAIADSQEWSGSATVNSDGSIQLFYTKNDTSGGKLNWQQLASATINLKVVDGEIVIDSVNNDKVLFSGDGYHYQNYQQFEETFNDDLNSDGYADRVDNYTLRDPHVIEVDGERYLIFEANTGTENYQGTNQVYNWSNYGGSDEFNLNSFLNITRNSELYKLASWANGAIGILKLDGNEKNPSVAEVYTPLLTSHMVTDEVERPSVVKLGDKYYMFVASRINKSTDAEGTVAARQAVGDDVVMLGFVSDSLMGTYTPLNGSGVVLTASVPADWRTSTYSYYAVPIEGDNSRVLITAYMTNRGEVAGEGKKSTWSPSFLLQLNEDGTTQVLLYLTNQGDWIWDESSNSLVHVGDEHTAKLPDEDYVVDFIAIGNYGLPSHTYPTAPLIPSIPVVTPTPTNVSTTSVPTTPTAPRTSKPNEVTGAAPSTVEKSVNDTVEKSVNDNQKLPNTAASNSHLTAQVGFMILTTSVLSYTALGGMKRRYNY